MRIIRPFAEQGGYVQMHVVILDHILPSVSNSAWKVLCFIMRKTVGWRKAADDISYKQIKLGTGIKSDSTIRSAIIELMGLQPDVDEAGKIIWVKDPNKPDYIHGTVSSGFKTASSYRLNFDVELNIEQEEAEEEPEPAKWI